MLTADPSILLHRPSGRLSHASLRERLGIRATQVAESLLRPFDWFGFSRVVRAIAAVSPSARAVRLAMADDAVFEFPYGDPYWSVLVHRTARYEPDVETLLTAIAGIDYAFIDCGANYGFWSVLASSRAFGSHPTIAVEAAPDTFSWLARNAALAGGRFTALHRAIADVGGRQVDIFGDRREARSIVMADGARASGRTETVRLDDLIQQPPLAGAARYVLKLDVEGAEIAALAGAADLLRRDVLIVYEDHGSDRDHVVSAHMQQAMGMRIYALDRSGVWPITALAEIAAFKRSRRWGYNFVACRSPFWIETMDRLAAARRAAAA